VTIVGSARGLRAGIDEIAETSIQLASKTTRQVADLENAFTTLKEITATVQDTAVGTDHARTIVAAAKNDAEQNNIIVRDAIDAINCIDKSSKQIGQIIGVIDEIAFQTNLLALNAGVEAARAGEAGRGFAVVASEVRSLAQRSTKAAKEIKQIIQASASQVDQGVDLVVRAGNALEHIASQVSEINVVVSRIAAGAQEQAAGLKQLNGSVNQINEITRVNAEMVQQSTNSARSLSEETSGLMSLVNRFELGEVVNRKQIPKGSNSVYRIKALKAGQGLADEGAARWRS
jgi:methyl-accepting chemotaxis protein